MASFYNFRHIFCIFEVTMKKIIKKIFPGRIRICSYLIIIFFIAISCEKSEEAKFGNYLIRYEHIKSSSITQLKLEMSLVSTVFPEYDSLLSLTKYGLDIYKVDYKTLLFGEPIEASGLVVLPQYDSLFPILSFQNGTNTCHKNTPSENTSGLIVSMISKIASYGYIIAFPDYIGYGSSDFIVHPYLHRESSNNSVIDLLHATQELIDEISEAPNASGDLFLMGYSQGGWATVSALKELETIPSTNLHVVAAAAGAGAYKLMDMAEFILESDEYPSPYFLPFFIESHHFNGILDQSLDVYFKEPYATYIPQFFSGSYCNSDLSAEFSKRVRDVITDDLVENFEHDDKFSVLRNDLKNNSIEAWKLNTPLRLFHSNGDKSIPALQTTTFYHNLNNLSDENQMVELNILNDTLGHDDAFLNWGIDALLWFEDVRNEANEH